MLVKLKTQLPQQEGMGWKISKFHEMLHLVDDMRRYGSPVNTNAATPEHNHVHFAKSPGRRARKMHATFNQQTATRVADSLMLKYLSNLMNRSIGSNHRSDTDSTSAESDKSEESAIVETVVQGTTFLLQINATNAICVLVWHSASVPDEQNMMVPELIQFIVKSFVSL